MDDPWNATPEEIELWARTPDAAWPTEDWDLAVATEDNAHLALRLASDVSCPARFFFLRCLYLFVGDAVRTEFHAHSRRFINALLSAIPDASPPYITRWAQRSRELLLTNATRIDYSLWCDGGLARAEQLELA
jgi:hypothetical protein